MLFDKLREKLESGVLHDDFIENGCKPVTKLVDAGTIIVYVKKSAEGKSPKTGKPWTLWNIGISDAPGDQDRTLYVSSFHESIPPKGTKLDKFELIYDEREWKDEMRPSFRVGKLTPSAEEQTTTPTNSNPLSRESYWVARAQEDKKVNKARHIAWLLGTATELTRLVCEHTSPKPPPDEVLAQWDKMVDLLERKFQELEGSAPSVEEEPFPEGESSATF